MDNLDSNFSCLIWMLCILPSHIHASEHLAELISDVVEPLGSKAHPEEVYLM